MHSVRQFRLKTLDKWEVASNEKRFPCVKFSVGWRSVCQFSAACFQDGSELPSFATHNIYSDCACLPVAVGGAPLAVVPNSRAGSICRRGGKTGRRQSAPSQLMPTGKGCSVSDSNHRRQCLPSGPFPSLLTYLDDARIQNFYPQTTSLSRICVP